MFLNYFDCFYCSRSIFSFGSIVGLRRILCAAIGMFAPDAIQILYKCDGIITECRLKHFRVHFLLFFAGVDYTSFTFTYAVEVSKCYQVNSENYCFYSDSSVWMSWDEANEFCVRRNSTLPIITDEDVDDVFQQFIVSDSYSLIQNRSVWIAAHARSVDNSDNWHWIDRRTSGRMTIKY